MTNRRKALKKMKIFQSGARPTLQMPSVSLFVLLYHYIIDSNNNNAMLELIYEMFNFNAFIKDAEDGRVRMQSFIIHY